MTRFFRAGLFCLLTICWCGAAAAQSEGGLRVITRVVPPFIVKREDAYGGFSADLWTAIAQQMNATFQWKEVATVKDILAGVRAGDGDLAIAAISITSQREQEFDFSLPMFESGIKIMVRSSPQGALSLSEVKALLTTGPMPLLLALLAALIVIPAHLAWLAERRHHSPLFSEKYFPGIFQAMWWSVGAAAGQQPDTPRSSLGRVLSSAAILVSVIFLAYFTAALTSALTVQSMRGTINGPEDLPGRRVGTITSSTSAAYLAAASVKAIEFAKVDEMFVALEGGSLDAAVFDAPVLLYHAATSGKGKVRVVGPVLRKEDYGILFPRGSIWRKPVNEALLRLRENGTYDAIYNKWFSAAGDGG